MIMTIFSNIFKYIVLYLIFYGRPQTVVYHLTCYRYLYLFSYQSIFLQNTVFHIVHLSDLETALKYTCDYRRYKQGYLSEGDNKQPRFYDNVQSVIFNLPASMINDICVLVVNKISGNTKTQSDYYIQYVVDFK